MADSPDQLRLYAADSPIHGTGLFAGMTIAEGTWIGTYEGRPTDRNGTYVLWVQSGGEPEWQGIDGSNLLRFLNHSAMPNAEFDGAELYALKSICRDEEITIDYGEWFEPDEQNPIAPA